jgi:hypothetical protein
VIFAALIPGETSPTRVAAQVVPASAFWAPELFFCEGLNVTGLNTAATLWCSAAVDFWPVPDSRCTRPGNRIRDLRQSRHAPAGCGSSQSTVSAGGRSMEAGCRISRDDALTPEVPCSHGNASSLRASYRGWPPASRNHLIKPRE